MAVFTCHFESRVLNFTTAFRIIIPTKFPMPADELKEHYENKGKLPVLWLFHGGSDSYRDWQDCTKLQLYAEKYNIAVVTPDAQNGSYATMAYGPDWATYVSKELREYVYDRFPISRERKDNFISGMSMGGLGALKTALTYPENYSVCCPIASAVDLLNEYVNYRTDPRGISFGKQFSTIYGHFEHPEEALGGPEDCYALLDKDLAEGKELPKLMMSQGTEDFTYKGNKRFYDYAVGKGVEIKWVEEPGMHDWDSWNLYLPKVFEFIEENR